MERENAWKSYTKADEKKLEELCDGYKDYLFNGKTEREGTEYIIEKAKKEIKSQNVKDTIAIIIIPLTAIIVVGGFIIIARKNND